MVDSGIYTVLNEGMASNTGNGRRCLGEIPNHWHSLTRLKKLWSGLRLSHSAHGIRPFGYPRSKRLLVPPNTRNKKIAPPLTPCARGLETGQPPETVIRRVTPPVGWQPKPGPREASRKNRLDCGRRRVNAPGPP